MEDITGNYFVLFIIKNSINFERKKVLLIGAAVCSNFYSQPALHHGVECDTPRWAARPRHFSPLRSPYPPNFKFRQQPIKRSCSLTPVRIASWWHRTKWYRRHKLSFQTYDSLYQGSRRKKIYFERKKYILFKSTHIQAFYIFLRSVRQ